MPPRALLAAAVALLVALAPTAAQEKGKDAGAKEAKAAAVANLKKAGIDKPTVVETPNFLVAGSLPEEKAKALGEVLEKTYAAGRKGLKFDDKESAWKGKLTVYYLPDAAEYKALMRRAFQVTPEGAHFDVRAESPYLVDPAEAVGKGTDADLYFGTAARVAGAMLKGKGTGTQVVPDWLRDGFGKVTAMRAEGTSGKRYAAYKTQAKAVVPKGKLPDVWADAKSREGELLGQSFAEYLTYGPGAAKFPMFLDALRPSDTNQEPTVTQALDAAGWKDKDQPALEAAWKKWVASGK
jgi:hypothetical protein